MTQPTTILTIDDDDAGRLMIQRALSYAGYRVLAARRASEGVDLARQHRPDLILTGVDLADPNESDIMAQFRATPELAAVPILALVPGDQPGARRRALAAGVIDTVNKPVDVATLTSQIEAALHSRSGAGERVGPAQEAYNRERVAQLETNVRELEATNQELVRLDQIKDDFIQLTAHELRTPLTTVYGYNRLVQTLPAIQEMMAQNEEVRACLAGLGESIERLNVVINEIITISRIASGRVDLRLGPTNLRDVIRRVVDGYAQVIEQRSLLLHYNSEEWPAQFFADAALLELAYSNLLSNAIKYTPDGGTIILRAQVQGDLIRTSIADTGIGIDPDQQDLIFDHFYTAGDTQLHSTSKTAFRGGGLGLGLAIARGVVEAHGGRIRVESEGYDEQRLPGATFYLEIPLRTQMPPGYIRRGHGGTGSPSQAHR